MLPHPGTILCYHSITSAELPSESAANVSIEQFLSEMALIRLTSRLVPLSELLHRRAAGLTTRGLVAVTFDDAYATILSLAAPHLRQLEVPFTVFVCSEATRRGSVYWWDRLEDLLPHLDARQLEGLYKIAGLVRSDTRPQGTAADAFNDIRQWVLRQHRGRCPAALDNIISEYEDRIGVSTKHRAMTFDELEALADMGLVEFGVHTATHPVLPLLSADEALAEIHDCYSVLRSRFAQTVPLLAAPYGLYSAATLQSARQAGMSATLTLGNRTFRWNGPGVPRFCITRDAPRWRLALRLVGVSERMRVLRDGPPPAYSLLS